MMTMLFYPFYRVATNPLKRLLAFVALVIIPLSANAQWIQSGIGIEGEMEADRFGSSVSLSSDGSTMAVGAQLNDDGGSNAGHVRVYNYDGTGWVQLGQDIDGEAADDEFGKSVSLSSDGSIVAIGARWNDGGGFNAGHVRVFAFDDSSWVQLGSDIDGESSNDRSGSSVSLSSDGSIVAIGATENNGSASDAGHVRVHVFDNDVWIPLGQDIDGESAFDRSGSSVSLSSDGLTVAIGAHSNDGNGSNSGHVRVYGLDGDLWIQQGADIDGEAQGDGLSSVSLSSDGLTLAVGKEKNAGNGVGAGHVRIYTFDAGSWVQLGADIDGQTANDKFGVSASLSSDGSIVAIGASNNDGSFGTAGHVRVFAYDGSNWVQLANDIEGEASNDSSGESVSLSSDGSVVAIGAIGHNEFTGEARVYSLDSILSITENAFGYNISVYPNPADEILIIGLGDNLVASVSIANAIGREIVNERTIVGSHNEISLFGLSRGVYFVKVSSGDQYRIMKFVKL